MAKAEQDSINKGLMPPAFDEPGFGVPVEEKEREEDKQSDKRQAMEDKQAKDDEGGE